MALLKALRLLIFGIFLGPRANTDCTFCLRIRIVNFATENVVILKHEDLQVSIMTDENCFEEIILEVATSRRFWLKG